MKMRIQMIDGDIDEWVDLYVGEVDVMTFNKEFNDVVPTLGSPMERAPTGRVNFHITTAIPGDAK